MHNIFQARVERRYITDYYHGSRSAQRQRRSHESCPKPLNIENNRPWLSANENKIAKKFPYKANARDFERRAKELYQELHVLSRLTGNESVSTLKGLTASKATNNY